MYSCVKDMSEERKRVSLFSAMLDKFRPQPTLDSTTTQAVTFAAGAFERWSEYWMVDNQLVSFYKLPVY